MKRSSIVRSVLAGLCFCLIAGACGLPVSEVEAISAEEHSELLNGTTTTTEPIPEPADPETQTLTLYFIADSKLERVERDFTKPVIDDVLNALEAGPSAEEQEIFEERGLLESRIPEGLAARTGGRNLELGIQRVDVDPIGELRNRLETDPSIARLTISQIVCTILGLPTIADISGIEIFDGEEEALQLSDNDAEAITGPATIEDFDSCRTGSDELEEIEERLEEEDPDAESETDG